MIPLSLHHLVGIVGRTCVLLALLAICWTAVHVATRIPSLPVLAPRASAAPEALTQSRAPLLLTITPGGHVLPLRVSSTLSVRAGHQVRFAVSNADSAQRILSIPSLGIYTTIAAARSGAPTETMVRVTPRRAGLYTWRLLATCSGDAPISGHIVVR